MKTIINEFAAYQKLGEWTKECQLDDGTWAEDCKISFRSQTIATFGKANYCKTMPFLFC